MAKEKQNSAASSADRSSRVRLCTAGAFTPRSSFPKAHASSSTQANASPGKPLPTTRDDPHTFNFGLENGDVINPEVGGNDARWINHSCDPNCEAVEEDDRIFIYALRNIQPGEELLYDYHMELDEPITESAKKKFACHCGASNCRGTMIELPESCG